MNKVVNRFVCCFLFFAGASAMAASSGSAVPAPGLPKLPVVHLRDFQDASEAGRIIAAALQVPPERRVAFVSAYFLGRKYHPETKKRIKGQRAPAREKREADNPLPLPVEILSTSFTYLDCMTYVEHVLALASADRPDYAGVFLPRLVDVMFNAQGQPLLNHLRSHFTSHWGDVNERKGYLVNVARDHALAEKRQVLLNRVGANRTFYVEDRFMISTTTQTVWYFPLPAVLAGKAPLRSGDVLALVCNKEGLDVTHMAFYIEQGGKKIFRHASLPKNRIVDQDLVAYLKSKKELLGLMVFRPRLAAPPPPLYQFLSKGN